MTSIDTRLPVSGMQALDPSKLKIEKDTSGDFEKMKAHWSAQTAKPASTSTLTISPEVQSVRDAGAQTKVNTQMLGQLEKGRAVSEFLEFMSKSPEERWHEQWLASKGLTQEEFDALPIEEQQGLIDEMTEELKRQAYEKIEEQDAAA